jgi:hypothetical protein
VISGLGHPRIVGGDGGDATMNGHGLARQRERKAIQR